MLYSPAFKFGIVICPVPFVISRAMFSLFILTVTVPSIDIVAVIVAFSLYVVSSVDIVRMTSFLPTLTLTVVEF